MFMAALGQEVDRVQTLTSPMHRYTVIRTRETKIGQTSLMQYNIHDGDRFRTRLQSRGMGLGSTKMFVRSNHIAGKAPSGGGE